MTQKCEFTNKSVDINAGNLESLKISTDRSSTANILSAFKRGSKIIRNLDVIKKSDGDQTLGELGDTIATFEKLTTLKLFSFDVDIELLEIYAKNYQN